MEYNASVVRWFFPAAFALVQDTKECCLPLIKVATRAGEDLGDKSMECFERWLGESFQGFGGDSRLTRAFVVCEGADGGSYFVHGWWFTKGMRGRALGDLIEDGPVHGGVITVVHLVTMVTKNTQVFTRRGGLLIGVGVTESEGGRRAVVGCGAALDYSDGGPGAAWVSFHSNDTGFFRKVSIVVPFGHATHSVVSAPTLVPVTFRGFTWGIKVPLPGKARCIPKWADDSFTCVKPVGLDFR